VEDQATRDPQLAARGFFETIAHPIRGSVVATGIPLGLSETPAVTSRTGAAIGADNRDVFCGLCGLTSAEFERLSELGVITDQQDFLAAMPAAKPSR
jgi:crotonobetainyl-CoA:carnitine CoA-transferase CaiB-like acyl-CoA transferase